MKKTITTSLALSLLCPLIPSVAIAAVSSGTCGENASWKLSNNTLTISGTGDMADEKPEWYDYAKDINKVVISEGITHIGASAFGGFESLKGTVTIPESVKSIGGYAFAGCENLEKVVLPKEIEEIGPSVFAECTKLSTLNIPTTTTSIGAHAFYETKWLSENKDAFVILGDGILYKYNGTEENIILPDDVKTINAYSFAQNTTIKSVNTAKATSMGSAAFMGCTSLEDVQISESLKTIGDASFKNCTALKSIFVPETVTQIGVGAFSNCTQLSEIHLPENTQTINTELFFNNSKLENFKIPTEITLIKELAFANTGLEEITIPENTEKICAGAFNNCENLKYAKFPKSIKEIEENAFIGCKNLSDVYYDGTSEDWSKISIADGNSVLGLAKIHFIDDLKITVNGKYISFDAEPFIKDDFTLVPLRAIFSALGAEVSWDDDTLTAIAIKGEDSLSVTIGADKMYKNGTEISLEAVATVVNDRTFIPARAVSEALNCKVDWDGETRTVIITE